MKKTLVILVFCFYSLIVNAQIIEQSQGEDLNSEFYAFVEDAENFLKFMKTPQYQDFLESEEYLKNKEATDAYIEEISNYEKLKEVKFFFDVSCEPDVPEIVCAAKGANAKRIKELLAVGADINETDKDGLTALMTFAKSRRTDLEVVEILARAEVEKNGIISATTLAYGVDRNNWGPQDIAVLKKMLEIGADVNGRTKYGLTPLMVAASGISVEKVKALVEAGAEVNARWKEWEYPKYDDDSDIITPGSYMLYNLGWREQQQVSPLSYAINSNQYNPLDIVEYLIEKGAKITLEEYNSFCFEVNNDNDEYMQKICNILNRQGYEVY